MDLLGVTAGLLRSGKAEFQHFDGAKVSLPGETVPDRREKDQLLRETWRTAQEFLEDNSVSDERALMYAAMTVGNGILLTHPFADGNGRTSRIISYVMANGLTNNTDDLRHLLSRDKTIWQVQAPNYVSKSIPHDSTTPERADSKSNIFLGEPKNEHFVTDSDKGGLTAMPGVRGNTKLAQRFLLAVGQNKEIASLIEKHSAPDETDAVTLDSDAFWRDIAKSPDAASYAKIVSEISRKIWVEKVENFLRAMRDNKRYLPRKDILTTAPVLVESSDDIPAEKEYKIKHFKMQQAQYAAYQRLNVDGGLTLRDYWLVDWMARYISNKIDNL